MENKIFDVAEVSSANMLAVRIRTTIKNTQKIMLDAAISIGQDLTAAKKLIAEGEWEEWVEQATEMTSSSARKYMQIAREYGEESKRELIPGLSYTKALKLLAVPEEDLEEFAKNNDIEGMTVKQLEEKVKELESVNSSAEAKAKKLEEDLQGALDENEAISRREKELIEQMNELKVKEDAPGGISEEAQAEIDKIRMEKLEEIKKLAKDKEAADGKVDKLTKQIEQLKQDQEKIVEKEKEKAATAAREAAKKESEEEIKRLMEITDIATKGQKDAEKKLAASSNEDVTKCKIRVSQMQEAFNDSISLLAEIEKNDPETAGKLRSGIHAILGQLRERL